MLNMWSIVYLKKGMVSASRVAKYSCMTRRVKYDVHWTPTNNGMSAKTRRRIQSLDVCTKHCGLRLTLILLLTKFEPGWIPGSKFAIQMSLVCPCTFQQPNE